MKLPKTPTLTAADFDFHLPPELIAQHPCQPRDHARLLVLERSSGAISHQRFDAISTYFKPGDVLVLNDSRVIPARLHGTKATGGAVEIFLLRKLAGRTWQVMIRGKVAVGQRVTLTPKVVATVTEREDELWHVEFNVTDAAVLRLGETPLPPYIKSRSKPADYQTVYAANPGSVAAPTAGLHFTKRLLARLQRQGVIIVHVTLHVGLGTFQPVKVERLTDHQMHTEYAVLSAAAARTINAARGQGKRVIACGTTAVRTLESLADKHGRLTPGAVWTNIFIYPGYTFKVIDGLITNFHLPQSTLLMLVAAFAGHATIQAAYQTAIAEKYRFYSFGDAMLIT